MDTGIVTHAATYTSPELVALREELDSLQRELNSREADLRDTQEEWQAFRARYMSVVGSRFAELEAVEELIKAARRANNLPDEEAGEAEPEDEPEEDAAPPADAKSFQPLASVRKLFWRVAKLFHPDLATDDEERQQRHHLMAEASRLYREGNEDRLTEMLDEVEATDETDTLSPVERAERARLRGEINQTRERLRIAEEEMKGMTESDLFYLKTKADDAARHGRDLLADLAARVAEQVVNARRRLEQYD